MLEASENIPKVTEPPSVEAGNPAHFEMISTPSERETFIEQALRDYESPLIGYASTILNDLDLARDVVQDTFTRLCRQDPDKVRDSLKSWLFTVCRNRAFDILRKENRSQSLEDTQWQTVACPELQPDEQTDQQERLIQLTGYLSRLSTNQREVIALKFQQGLSYQEIHRITGLTTGNIGFLIHTGLKRLREILPADLRS
jgi:RNA polymerase sigma factor (sigma-70 family)